MNKLKLHEDKRAEAISQTLTWLVATFIIIAVLAISLAYTYATSMSKEFTRGDLILGMEDDYDVLAGKSEIAFQIKNENKKEIEQIINDYEK